ncbi:MAG: TauD/TfdA family dioxygenase, partial [Rhizorhabdus sp.]
MAEDGTIAGRSQVGAWGLACRHCPLEQPLRRPGSIRKDKVDMATRLRIGIEPITPVVGAIVSGVDLRDPLDEFSVEQLHAAALKHGALFFRNQDLTKQQTTAFLSNFGKLTLDPYSKNYKEGVPEDQAVRDYETFNDNAKATQFWHIDSTLGEKPANFLSLR